jgi:hypothetical protein
MDFRRIDPITGTIRVKGIGGENSRRNARQGQQQNDDEQEESAEQQELLDRVSIATLHAPHDEEQPAIVARVQIPSKEEPEDHPHLDLTV